MRSDLLRQGLHPDLVRAQLRRQELLPLQRGVYHVNGRPPTPLDRALAAVLAVAQSGSAASHSTAARVHGLVVPKGGPEHVTVPRTERRPHRNRLRLHTARLPEADVELHADIPLTSPSRTLVDLCRLLSRVDAVWAVECALARGEVSMEDMDASASRLARTPGIVAARDLFRSARPLSGSPLETEARLVIVDAGLPEPELQVKVPLGDGGHVFVDLAYPELRLGFELDGRDHDRPEAVFHDRWRQNAVHAEEWVLYRFTFRDIRYGRMQMIDTIARARTARAPYGATGRWN